MSFSVRKLLLTLSLCFSISCRTGPSSGHSKRMAIRVAVTRGSLGYLPVLVAGPSGCLEKQGLTVEIEQTEGVPKSLIALLAGAVDVVAGGYMQVLDLAAHGRPVRAFLLIQRFPGFAAVALPGGSRSIRTIEDLKGAKVGVPAVGGEPHRILNYVIRQHGMKPEDMSAISVGPTVTQHVPALERGVVDALVSQGVTISFLQRRHPDLRILFDTRTPELTRAALGAEEVPQSVLIAQENWLHSYPDTARRLAGASLCALAWIQDHTAEQIREALPASFHSPDKATDLDAISSGKRMLSRTGRMSPEMHEAALRVSGAVGKVSMQQAFTNDFLGEP